LKRILLSVVAATAVLVPASQAAGPITKQNGKSPAIEAFTSICAVAGYANYGFCAGDTKNFTNVKGKMNAIQAKPGRYNLEFEFGNLTPGVEYRLWSTSDGRSFTEVGRMVASATGEVAYKLQTESPGGLGFDLNTVSADVTIMTSWWSGQKLVVNPDTTLGTAA
jgi:hypothetical protein